MNKLNSIIKSCISLNILLYKKNLVVHNFGNASVRIDDNHFTIKPSGMLPDKITIKDMPIIRISDSKQVDGKKKTSVDTPTHLQIYKSFNQIKSVVHTHSKYATSWAQSGKSIPLLGTTHADYWHKDIPNLNFLTKKQVKSDYEKNTGIQIAKLIKKYETPFQCPGIIFKGHGVFTWGKDINNAIEIAEVLEFISEIAYKTINIGIKNNIPDYLVNKHFNRKYGVNAYYGQKKTKK